MNTAVWRKARRSNDQGGSCVELAAMTHGVAVRDSKDPDGPGLVLDRGAFRLLVANLKDQ